MPISNKVQTRHLMTNPGWLYLNTNPDADGRIALAADGTPDATANPDAVYLGATKAGAEFMESRTTTPIECDEEDGPIGEQLTKRAASLSAEIMELGDFDRLHKLLPGTKYEEDTDTISISAGGQTDLGLMPVTLVTPRREDSTKFVVFQLMLAFNSGEFKVTVSRTGAASTPVKFEGRNDPSRPVGERLYKIWKQKIAGE